MVSGLITYADPFRAGRHPFQTFLLLLCAISGLPLIFGHPNTGSVSALLPTWAAVAWGIILSVGSTVALIGAYWPARGDRLDPHTYATALTIERIGLSFVGPGALVYAVTIVMVVGWRGMLAASLAAGLGWAALRRQRDVGRVFTRAIHDR